MFTAKHVDGMILEMDLKDFSNSFWSVGNLHKIGIIKSRPWRGQLSQPGKSGEKSRMQQAENEAWKVSVPDADDWYFWPILWWPLVLRVEAGRIVSS